MSDPLATIATFLFVLICIPLPFGTDHRRTRFPWMTYSLIAVNGLVFAATEVASYSAGPGYDPIMRWGLVPRNFGPVHIVTSMFVHVSVSHILWNMAFLWLFGRDVEDALGHLAYLLFYLGGGVAAALLHVAIVLIFAQNSVAAGLPLAGASGAISAVLGLYAIRFYGARLRFIWVGPSLLNRAWGDLEAPAIYGLGLWIGFEVWNAVASLFYPEGGVAYWAHIGGFIFGMVAAMLTDMLGEGAREYLLTEAKSAQERGGDRELAKALRRYWVILSRRPSDQEARDGLAELIQESAQAGAEGHRALAAECCELLDVSIAAGDHAQAVDWYSDLLATGFNPPMPPRTLSLLAAAFLRQDDYRMAAQLYHRLLQRFPDCQEAEWTYLELATLELAHLGAPDQAAILLKAFLDRYPASAHRSLAASLLATALSGNRTK